MYECMRLSGSLKYPIHTYATHKHVIDSRMESNKQVVNAIKESNKSVLCEDIF